MPKFAGALFEGYKSAADTSTLGNFFFFLGGIVFSTGLTTFGMLVLGGLTLVFDGDLECALDFLAWIR